MDRFGRQKKSVWRPLVYERARAKARWNAVTVSCRDSYSQNSLHSHRMATITPVMEETTGATPLTIIIFCSMNIILAPECCFKTSKLDAFRLFCVLFRLGDFVNHA
jgi:hypothetical protein